jgi:hypothetical protein
VTGIEVDPGDVVALFALAIAIWSAWQTQRFNKRQTAFQETAERLNLLLVEKETAESGAQKRADVSANFYRPGKNNHRLKVFNRGPSTARNVRVEVLDEAGILLPDDIGRKFPVPTMDRHQAVELIGRIHMQSPPRTHIRLTWDDDAGQDHTKELHLNW